MLCSLIGFDPQEHITLSSPSWQAFGRQYGALSRPITEHRWRSLKSLITGTEQDLLSHIPEFRKSLIKMSESQTFAVDGMNWFWAYKELLTGFSIGSDLPFDDILALQIIDNIMCQTIVIQEKETEDTVVMHMEESTADESLTSTEKPAYDYRVVDAKIGSHRSRFFAYPGLCFGGPAIGLNKTTNSLIVVDSLFTVPYISASYSIWGNAMDSVFFLMGSLEKIKSLVSILGANSVGYIDGYAVQVVEKKEDHVSIASVEFGGDTILFVPPSESQNRRYIAQPNIVRSKEVASWDSLKRDPQKASAIEMERRQIRLNAWAEKIPVASEFAEMKKELSAVCSLSPGDRYEDNGPPETGFLSSSVASYAFALITKGHAKVEIGKGFPEETKDQEILSRVAKEAESILPPITIHYPNS